MLLRGRREVFRGIFVQSRMQGEIRCHSQQLGIIAVPGTSQPRPVRRQGAVAKEPLRMQRAFLLEIADESRDNWQG